jgi:hypothetical protein
MQRGARIGAAAARIVRRATVPLKDSSGEWLTGRELRVLLEALASGFGILGVNLSAPDGVPDHLTDVLALCRQNRLTPSLATNPSGLKAAFSAGVDWKAFESVILSAEQPPDEWDGKVPAGTPLRVSIDLALDPETIEAWVSKAIAVHAAHVHFAYADRTENVPGGWPADALGQFLDELDSASIPWTAPHEASLEETDANLDRLVRNIFEEKSRTARLHRLEDVRRYTDRFGLSLPRIVERAVFFLEAKTRTPPFVVFLCLVMGHFIASFMRSGRNRFAREQELTGARSDSESCPQPPVDLVMTARDVAANLAAATEIKSSAYGLSNAPFDKMNGSIKWWSAFHERLLTSTVLRLIDPPFTISARFAGEADYIGFSFAANAQIMCPMTAESHRLVLHVSASGDYVLLKDGKPERPLHMAGMIHRAGRVPPGIELRLASYGYRLRLITQEVLLWETAGEDVLPASSEPLDLSVIVVCTKYSRRLSLLVKSIAQQRDFDLRKAELLVAHVPGLDGTEDLLDCASLAWPALRIVPIRFPPDQQTSKGLMINLCVRRASGRRILVADADVIFPPDVFHRLETEYRDERCVAVAGRKMLDKKTTADLLLGLRDPMREFQELASGPGELRILEAKGTPIGFFQCVRRADFAEVNYEEMPHFEGADYRFASTMGSRFGGWTIIRDAVVLHLDHSGSRWFGTDRQM